MGVGGMHADPFQCPGLANLPSAGGVRSSPDQSKMNDVDTRIDVPN
jgi:hypothetical protein